MTDLKPCPFCGGEPYLRYFHRDDPRYDNSETSVHCTDCGVHISRCGHRVEEVMELWNRRDGMKYVYVVSGCAPDVGDVATVGVYESKKDAEERLRERRETCPEFLYNMEKMMVWQ